MGGNRSAYKILVGTYEGKRPLRRPMHRLEDNIKMDFKETGCGLDSTGSGEGQWWESVNMVKNLRGKF
jgi:hypothetical protein